MRKLLVFAFAVALSASAMLYSTDASAWTHTGYFTRVRVLDHNFNRVKVYNSGCYLHFQVYFYAPSYRYRSGSYRLNYYRFQAKVTMSGGAWIRTPVFGNSSLGNLTYTYTHNRGPQGCWGTRYHKVKYLVVHSCRGRGCYVRPVR